MDSNQIDPKTQKKLNEPLAKPSGFSQEDLSFLDLVMSKTEKGEINLMQPNSLINHAVYDNLSHEQQGKVDFDAFNIATTLRNIRDLWNVYKQPTFQIENMVHQIRITKERLEEISGDVYVI